MGENRPPLGIEENLKKALSELLVLALLHRREYYALELTKALSEYSGGVIHIAFPYAILYRMTEQGYIQELPRRKSPDGRRRQYFGITDAGRRYFSQIRVTYQNFTSGVERVLSAVGPEEKEGPK